MWQYEAPLRDMRYVIEDVLCLPAQWAALPAFAELDADTARAVLDEAARFATEVLAPTNANGDLEGCTLAEGEVRTPRGYKEAYRAFVAAGWPALACDPAVGGQGLPQVLNAALYEMLAAANHAWTMYPGLLHGAYECLHLHASDELKQRYLGKVVSGEWLSTMCLTEAHAGSDLGLLATRTTERFLVAVVHVEGRAVRVDGLLAIRKLHPLQARDGVKGREALLIRAVVEARAVEGDALGVDRRVGVGVAVVAGQRRADARLHGERRGGGVDHRVHRTALARQMADVALDLGTTWTRIAIPGRGVVLEEPSVIAAASNAARRCAEAVATNTIGSPGAMRPARCTMSAALMSKRAAASSAFTVTLSKKASTGPRSFESARMAPAKSSFSSADEASSAALLSAETSASTSGGSPPVISDRATSTASRRSVASSAASPARTPASSCPRCGTPEARADSAPT